MIENAPILANYKGNIKDVLTPVLSKKLEESVKISSTEQFKDAPKKITYIIRLDKPLQLDEITVLTNNDKIATQIKNNLKNKQQITRTIGFERKYQHLKENVLKFRL